MNSEVGKTMAVVMPFAHDIDKLEENIGRWSKINPCGHWFKTKHFIDLILYQNQDAFTGENVQLADRIDNLITKIQMTGCFRQVHYISADLNKWEDRYGLGTSRMFFKIMTENDVIKESGYSFLFWMEPDCWPIREGWLDRLYHLATTIGPHFWVVGSITRTRIPNGFENIKEHINGNAIYRLDDPVFLDFLHRCHLDFDNNLSKNHSAFDTAIFLFLRDLEPFTEQAKIWHKFVYMDLVQNVYRTPTKVGDILKSSPGTFLLHGRELIE